MRATMRTSHAARPSGGRGPSTSRGRPRTTGSDGPAAAAGAPTEELDDEELGSLLPGASDEEDDEDEGSPQFNFTRHRRKRDQHEHECQHLVARVWCSRVDCTLLLRMALVWRGASRYMCMGVCELSREATCSSARLNTSRANPNR